MVKVNFEMHEEELDELKKLTGKINARSAADVIRAAISLYSYLTSEFGKGNQLIIRNKKMKEKEIKLLYIKKDY